MPIEKRIRVEIFLPLRSDLPNYPRAIDWMAEEFARQRGGATLTAPFAGFFASSTHADIVEDAIRILFSDFQLDIENAEHTTGLIDLLEDVKRFLMDIGGRRNLGSLLSAYANYRRPAIRVAE